MINVSWNWTISCVTRRHTYCCCCCCCNNHTTKLRNKQFWNGFTKMSTYRSVQEWSPGDLPWPTYSFRYELSSIIGRLCYIHIYTPALQKPGGCFNHSVVTLVADKLERQWLWEVHFCFLKAGTYKTWTLNSGLDWIKDLILDWTSCFGTFQGFPPSHFWLLLVLCRRLDSYAFLSAYSYCRFKADSGSGDR